MVVREAEVWGQRDETGADGERGDSKEFPETVMSARCCFHGCVLESRNVSDPRAAGWSGSEARALTTQWWHHTLQEKSKLD